MYVLGVDLGTTYTAAATWRDGHTEICSLGSRSAAIPSVVLLRDDETVLTGETANRRGLTEPHRVAREFKRRLGDTTPILLGGAPYSAEALMAKLLRSVIDEVASREGGPAAAICISHPANWGPYKKDLLSQAVRLANIEQPVTFTTEPEAAAVLYAHQQRIEPGAVVAVYDLGGGTFDAAVLRKTETGFEILGQPEGIERLGGIDFDAAVFNHVSRALGGKLADLDENDPGTLAAVARLREECVEAKEALSSDTDVSIPVLLPNIATEVRLTRAELEAMVRPALHHTIEALRRALRSAGVSAEQLHAVLLVGGSSRMPLVAQLVGAELGRPVAVDAHPKHAVSLGAAWLASGAGTQAPTSRTVATASVRAVPPAPPPIAPAVSPAAAAGVAGAAGMAGAAMGPAGAAAAEPPPVSPTVRPPTIPPVAATAIADPLPPLTAAAGPTRGTEYGSRAAAGPVPPPSRPGSAGGNGRRPLLVVAGALALVIAAGAVAWAVASGDPGGGVGQGTESPSPQGTGTATTEPTPPPPPPPPPADEQCTDEIQANTRWACVTSAVWDGSLLTVEYDEEWAGAQPDINGSFHLHLYGGDGTDPPAEIMGRHFQGEQGNWLISDDNPVILDSGQFADYIGDAPKVCIRIANGNHELVPDDSGGYATGNCWPIEGS